MLTVAGWGSQRGLGWSGDWCGVVWCGVVWCGVVCARQIKGDRVFNPLEGLLVVTGFSKCLDESEQITPFSPRPPTPLPCPSALPLFLFGVHTC